MDSEKSIDENIRMLETFASALVEFFQRCDEKSLFKRFPPKEAA